jgi:hypothetical protein
MPETIPPVAPGTVNAAPTKRFFISVLIKDIQFIDAIVELVDNSVDSGRSKRGGGDFTGIVIDINYTDTQFSIADNAPGISLEVAKMSAFRFGRPDNAPITPGAVGEFGVGMKRALFKIGRHFVVSSRTEKEFFSVDVDVEEWEAQPETDPNGWNFVIKTAGTNEDAAKTGTTIVVDGLFDYAVEELKSVSFDTRLITILKEAHANSITSGLQIIVNKTPVSANPATLLSSSELSPISSQQVLEIDGKQVTVRIIAGIEEEKLADAGWYVYCNGRQIERAEKTDHTGWNSAIEGGEKIPKPHWQFRRFRGYLFFESDFPDVLPWNTTKTGLNIEAPAFRRIRSDMNSAMLQVIGFLNQLDADDEGPLSASVNAAPKVQLTNLPENPTFLFEAAPSKPQPKRTRIAYSKDTDIVDAVKDSLGVKSNKEVGEQTFDYYVREKGIDGQ